MTSSDYTNTIVILLEFVYCIVLYCMVL